MPIDDKIIDQLCEASDRQLDEKIFPRLQALKGASDEEVRKELLLILDDCAIYALASDFVMQVLHVLWEGCGGTDQERQDRLPEREERTRRNEEEGLM